ncbi:MAG: thiamine phosphate synthase, partial [Candidatus Korobacteraceae bacterium]
MLLYYITDRRSLAGTEAQQYRKLLTRIGEAARAGVDYIQLREKNLAVSDLERLARDALQAVRDHSPTAKLLVNGRADVA